VGLVDTAVAPLARDTPAGFPGAGQDPTETAAASPGADNWAKTVKGHKTEIKKHIVITKWRDILMIALHVILS